MIEYGTVELKDKSLFYAVSGEGKPVVLIHGNGESHVIFETMRSLLVEGGYKVYAPDSPGHGANKPLPEYHYKDMAEDLYAFIKELELEKPVLYGFSDGGIIGLMIALAHPGALSLLAVSGANLSPDGLTASFREKYEGLTDPLTVLMFAEPHIDPEELRTIEIPVLVTAGSEDLILPEETEKIAEHIPGSTLIIVNGEDHGSYIENSEIMGNLLLDFMKEEGY